MQGSKLYVGNLSYDVTKEGLTELFSTHGSVKEVNIIDGKGFGFVEMATDEEAQKAIELFDGKEFEGRAIKVNEARPMEARPPRRDFNRGGGRGFGGGQRW